jgi:hypothetical protein
MARRITVITHLAPEMFVELALACVEALQSYGFDAVYCVDPACNKQTDFNIIVSNKKLKRVSKNNINVVWETEHIETIYRKKYPVDYTEYTRSLHWFDYKQDLTDRNIHFCPIGYSKWFDTSLPKRDIWPYFHMGATRRGLPRYEFRKKFGIQPDDQIYGRSRDVLIMRSKVNINTRAYEDYWFTPLHAALILFKGKMLLQDDTDKDDYYFYKPYLNFFTEDDFVEKLHYWLEHDKERHEWEHFIHEDMKAKFPFEKYLYDAIGDLLEDYR